MKLYADRAVRTPLGMYVTLWYFADYFADSSMLMLVGALAAVFLASLFAGAAMPPGPAVLASLGVPALATAFDLYWRLETRAPYGPARHRLLSGSEIQENLPFEAPAEGAGDVLDGVDGHVLAPRLHP